MSAPPTPPQCPDWCEVGDHEDDAFVSHCKTFVRWNSPDDSRATSVIVRVRQYGDRAPYIRLWGYHDPHPISRTESHGITLDAGQARLLAAVITPEPVAQALREAADELDRIGGGS
jgi:hypothetical protein